MRTCGAPAQALQPVQPEHPEHPEQPAPCFAGSPLSQQAPCACPLKNVCRTARPKTSTTTARITQLARFIYALTSLTPRCNWPRGMGRNSP